MDSHLIELLKDATHPNTSSSKHTSVSESSAPAKHSGSSLLDHSQWCQVQKPKTVKPSSSSELMELLKVPFLGDVRAEKMTVIIRSDRIWQERVRTPN